MLLLVFVQVPQDWQASASFRKAKLPTRCAPSDESCRDTRVDHRLLSRKEMGVAPDVMRGDQQGESNLFSTLMALGEFLSGDASDFVIVMMAVMADLVDS